MPDSSISTARLWTSRIVQWAAILFLVMDGVMKLFKPSFVVEATVGLGYPVGDIVPIGVALLISTALYAIPRTSALGAILVTGYLGGAIASDVRAQTPFFNVAFPFLFAVIVWGALWLRDERLRRLIPLAG